MALDVPKDAVICTIIRTRKTLRNVSPLWVCINHSVSYIEKENSLLIHLKIIMFVAVTQNERAETP